MKIGQKISACRKKRGMSQEDLAERIEVSRQAVSRWETGESVPDVEKIKALCRIFEVPADYLLFDEKEELSSGCSEEQNFSNEKSCFRRGAYIAITAVRLLLVAAACILAVIETYQPYQEYYADWGPLGTYLFRSWRTVPLGLGAVLTSVGIYSLYREYKKM